MRRRPGGIERLTYAVCGGAFAVVAVLYGWYLSANIVPAFRPPQVALPNPNAYDALVAAP